MKFGTILALDVGDRRIGVAIANMQVRIASPLTTLIRSDSTEHDVQALIDEHSAVALVVGLPRGLDGQSTKQTVAVEEFKAGLERALAIPVYWQDEALTSRHAEAELRNRGKPYSKADIDSLSATYILNDFMGERPGIFL